MSKTETPTVIEQIGNLDGQNSNPLGRPMLWHALIGAMELEELSMEEWLHPLKLSGGRIALRIDYLGTDNHQFVTVESDELRMVLDNGEEHTGPHIRGVMRDCIGLLRAGEVSIEPVLTADTPLWEDSNE